jgi:hypothetical protein
VRNADVKQSTNTKDIVAVVQNLKWKWESHVARKDRRRWAHATSMWEITLAEEQGDRRLDRKASSRE